ncbi:hypothetical protein C7N43_05245 [Sphingobacteriales bacterium UPWRP_1]|nr:hypothetical protein BVG80_09735 [Sphingobacteriales bacterium TSM_CSM]PSJ78108.1 hypothetical protein C7N43_05245 [Sphingobacteriales bacterium UPWRP_1]
MPENIALLFTKLKAPAPVGCIAPWFIRAMGVIYLVALVPFLFQYQGLWGQNGLLPAAKLLQTAFNSEGWYALLHFPSLLWLYPCSDVMLLVIIAGGCAGALGMLCYVAPHWSALLAWGCFVSVTTVGGDFSVIIIDLFLAETGFLTVLLAFCLRYFGYVPVLPAFLLRLLLFRLWFSMGMVKFYFPGESWRNFTFFDYFFPFQPMPTPLAWYFHKLPVFWFKFTIVATFIVEMIVPFFVFFGRVWRYVAVACFTAISVLIMLSGNYGYFNILSIVLSLLLLQDDDSIFGHKSELAQPAKNPSSNLTRLIWVLVLCLGLFSGSMQVVYTAWLFSPNVCNPQNHLCYPFYFEAANRLPPPFGWVNRLYRIAANFRLSNPYGVFKDINRFRVELRFEGSYDGINWQPYEFKYVPSGYTQALKWFAPYYPRLDHVMYYETIGVGAYNANPLPPFRTPQNPLNPYYTPDNAWICNFVAALRNNTYPVTGLLQHNPFAAHKPAFVRVRAYALRFTTNSEMQQTGRWWQEKYLFTAYNTADDRPCKPLTNLQNLYDRYLRGEFNF